MMEEKRLDAALEIKKPCGGRTGRHQKHMEKANIRRNDALRRYNVLRERICRRGGSGGRERGVGGGTREGEQQLQYRAEEESHLQLHTVYQSREMHIGVGFLEHLRFLQQEQEAHAAEMERTFIANKPDGVQRGLISDIIARFERKGFKLVAVKIVAPSKDFAEKHYHDLKERPFFNGLCDFLSSGPVLAMVWEGEGVIEYGRKLIGATDPQKSEPGTIRGDLAVVVGRNIIHGSDGPDTAKDEINLWFKPEELVTYTSNAEKWIYGDN
ncbi:hypothetical protein BUALT_Bualt05G0044500 [Buddleja alternifolia]|uniref:Nucleoside diphosphate kinase n=1 Tax=Buddleja alternifolia TaxID=168488 RepID=A0AAV6XI47_9LAMI|nr:hypothetical protein BUALT_Bualt05G0044500 [Buddleja alternifolia]